MRLSKAFIKNYRNFLDEEININEKSLLIGPNDVGKSNLLKAIRIVLDKTYSSLQLEPNENDFNVFGEDNEITITLEFTDITEYIDDYILAKFKCIKDGTMYITYKGYKNSDEPYKFYVGHSRDLELMKEVPRQFITNTINCVYLNSTRELKTFLRKAKIKMIENYKNKREIQEIENDSILIEKINNNVETLNQDIERISYINKSTDYIKKELDYTSNHNNNLDIKLSSYNDFDDITSNVDLVTVIDGKQVELGGDGRSNQIYMSMWIKEMNELYDENNQFVIFIIEEPESHLFFPTQSITIRRIIKTLKNQLIVSSHSPKIVLEFQPNSIIRLYFDKKMKTKIANHGCSKEIEDAILKFGYRNNLINGEMFFADSVVLVEGPSELMLYKELANQLNKPLEKYNISVISVDGIGFESYVNLLETLEIPYSVRTDNDIQKQRDGKYNYTGVNRLIKIYNKFANNNGIDELAPKNEKELTVDEKHYFDKCIEKLKEKNLFLSDKDLENDLINTNVGAKITELLERNSDETIKYLQEHKAIRMFELLSQQIDITELKNTSIYFPLNCLYQLQEDDANG